MSNVHLYIDDMRQIPPQFTHVVRTPDEAISFLEASLHNGQKLITVAFDHDMGWDECYNEFTTRPVMQWMVDNNFWPAQIFIHTSNVWGGRWLKQLAKEHAPVTTSIEVVNNNMYWS